MRSLPWLSASLLFVGCGSVHNDFVAKVENEFARRPPPTGRVLENSDLADLPAPVRAYIARTGSIGKPVPFNMRIEFDARMWRKPGGKALPATSVQYNFQPYDVQAYPARIFYMKASQFLIPFRVLHAYSDTQATMLVRVAGLFNAVDLKGEELSRAETVTLLNDLCVFAPGALADKRLRWEAIDSTSFRVHFTNGPYRVSATLHFNDRGELVNFTSEDRAALQDDGSMKLVPWSTPLSEYKEFDGRMLASKGSAIYHYPEGDFTYGEFVLKSVDYNLTK